MVQRCHICVLALGSSEQEYQKRKHSADKPVWSRRAFLPSMVWMGNFIVQSAASAEDISEEAARARFFGGANIVPALGVPEYLQRIANAWPPALRVLQDYVEGGQYKELSESLFLSPFDDVRQAAFYIPYALAREDVTAAVRSRSAYEAFLDDVKQLYATAQAAAAYQGEEQDVELSVQSLSASLQSFLRTLE